MRRTLSSLLCVTSLCVTSLGACSSTEEPPVTTPPVVLVEGTCAIGTETPDSVTAIPCKADYDALSSEPLDTSIPGARSVKVVFDRGTDGTLYFQNSKKYSIHHEFAAAHLSGNGQPLVPGIGEFSQTEYYSPDRRFLLGAVTYYEGPGIWALEIAPYDTASSEMIAALHAKIAAAAWFGPALAFHPNSSAVTAEAAKLSGITVVTTDQIYAGIGYQPLNLATAMGRLRFLKATELASTYVSYRDIVVLDNVPNDISVVSGIITEEFQTPLSHINVLSRNRKTPNMGLKGASTNTTLRALDGQWIELDVSATAWSVRAVTSAEADAYWEAHRPTPVVLDPVDTSRRDLPDIEDVVSRTSTAPLRARIKAAIPAFGGKTVHYSVMYGEADIPMKRGFAVPAYYYVQFMEQNGFYARVDGLLADASFRDDPAVRDAALASLRDAIGAAPLDQGFQDLLKAKMDAEYPGQSLRFRSSTNSEDLDGFPCAGCYESHTGQAGDWEDVMDAIRETWASIWLFRTFEERAYNGIDHQSVVMALLVHTNFPDEEANGVAVTSNPFDPAQVQPGYYINVQFGGAVEVVHPPAGTTSDQILYLFDQPGQPVTYLSHSNLVDPGATVLSNAQLFELGKALQAIHELFSPAYGPASGNDGWYAMDVEFKFDDEGAGGTPKLFIKQARPYPAPDR